MEIRKADSKGRVITGKPGVNYYVEETPDGRIELRPVPEYKGLRIIEMNPGEGKTTRLMQMLLEPGNEDVVYVAPTNSQAQIGYFTGLSLKNQSYGPNEGRGTITDPKLYKRCMSYETFKGLRKPGMRIVVDEFEGVASNVFGAQVLAISGTDAVSKAKWREDRQTR